VIHVIENKEDAGTDPCIKLSVYRSPTNPNRILGRWQHSESVQGGDKGLIAISQSQLGTPIEIEFQRTVDCGYRCGVPFLWVDDPLGLYPPSERPSFRIASTV
jgi:hypothetical protein